MKNDFLVAVWMVTYNQEAYIREAVTSIMAQKTTFNYKLFIGEDYSTDATRSICAELKKEYSDRIELILNRRNIGGMKNAINVYKQCLNSSSKYIALCEGDDYWTDTLKLQKQVDFLEQNSDYNICFHEISVLNQETGELEEDTIARKVSETTTILDLARGNFIHTPSVMLRCNFKIPRWFVNSSIGDWTLYMLCVNDKKIKKMSDTMAVYRVHKKSSWSSKSQEERIRKTVLSVKLLYMNKQFDNDVNSILKSRLGNLGNLNVLEKLLLKIKKMINEF